MSCCPLEARKQLRLRHKWKNHSAGRVGVRLHGSLAERMNREHATQRVQKRVRLGPRQSHLPLRTLASSLRTCTLIAPPSARAASARSAFIASPDELKSAETDRKVCMAKTLRTGARNCGLEVMAAIIPANPAAPTPGRPMHPRAATPRVRAAAAAGSGPCSPSSSSPRSNSRDRRKAVPAALPARCGRGS